jgi:ABC-type transport system involved in multi-copper enzyme maturation permease subunit
MLYLLMLGSLALIGFTFFVEWNAWSTTQRVVWIFVAIFVSLLFYVITKNAKRVYDDDDESDADQYFS